MDSGGACADQLNQCDHFEDSPKFFSQKLEDGVSNKEAVELSKTTTGAGSLEPITPVVNREIVDFPFVCNSPITEVKRRTSSPIREAKGQTKDSCFDCKTSRKEEDSVACVDDSSSCSSPKTPIDVVFDPFAPGDEKFAMAPLGKRYVDQMRTSVARRLKMESSLKFLLDATTCDADGVAPVVSDEEIIETMYKNISELIFSQQNEGAVAAEISNNKWVDSDCCMTPPLAARLNGIADFSNNKSVDSDRCKTPPLAPRLNGIAETCPGAPMKPSAKSRKIDLGICRKLEF